MTSLSSLPCVCGGSPAAILLLGSCLPRGAPPRTPVFQQRELWGAVLANHAGGNWLRSFRFLLPPPPLTTLLVDIYSTYGIAGQVPYGSLESQHAEVKLGSQSRPDVQPDACDACREGDSV